MEAKTSYAVGTREAVGTRAAVGTREILGNGPIPVQADRGLGCILNDLLGQCKEVQGTIDELRAKLEPLLAPTPQPQDVDGVCPFVSTSANELAVNVERELISIRRRLQELIRTTSV